MKQKLISVINDFEIKTGEDICYVTQYINKNTSGVKYSFSDNFGIRIFPPVKLRKKIITAIENG